jgi:hypothetical protein
MRGGGGGDAATTDGQAEHSRQENYHPVRVPAHHTSLLLLPTYAPDTAAAAARIRPWAKNTPEQRIGEMLLLLAATGRGRRRRRRRTSVMRERQDMEDNERKNNTAWLQQQPARNCLSACLPACLPACLAMKVCAGCAENKFALRPTIKNGRKITDERRGNSGKVEASSQCLIVRR